MPPALKLVVSQNWSRKTRLSKLASVSCRMLPAASSPMPSVSLKVARLHSLRPGAAAVVEQLVDDLLADL